MLNKNQKKLLKNLMKVKTIDCAGISESDMEIYEYLKSLGYIKIKYDSYTCPGENGKFITLQTEPLSISIDEPGKGYLASEKNRKLEIWVPHIITFVISLIALFISFVSLSTTSPEVWKSILEFLNSL